MPTRWKGIQLDYTTLLSFDSAVQIPVCLTQRQVAILKALLIPAYWETRWINLPVTADQLEAEMAELDSQLDGNDCEANIMDFRDNPSDPCEVQYSKDGGETWLTMFRKDICPVASLGDISIITNNQTEIENNNTTWNNDITNLAPEWEYEDENSDKALCWVIDFYVEWICDVSIQEIKSHNAEIEDDVALWDDVLEQFAAGLIAAMVFIKVDAAVAGAVAWAVIEIATELYVYLQTVSYEHFQDEEAKQAVKCAMYHHIRGETPQWEDWEHSLDDFVPANVPETSISTTVALWNSVQDVYINYLFTLEDINSVSESLPDCPCPQSYVINQLYGPEGQKFGRKFTRHSDLAFSNPGDDPAYCPGEYIPANDFYQSIASSIGGVGCNVRVTLPSNAIVVNIKVKWTAYREFETSEGDKNAAIWVGEPYGDGVYVGGHSWPPGQGVPYSITTEIDTPGGMTATPRSHVYIHNSMDRPNGYANLAWIYIELIPYVP